MTAAIRNRLPLFVLRIWYRMTGDCASFRPDTSGICRVCRWERNA